MIEREVKASGKDKDGDIISLCNSDEKWSPRQKKDAIYDIELLGSLPLAMSIREQTDSGRPSVIAEPDSAIAESYRATARSMAAKLATQGKDYSSRFPKIVIEDS